MPSSFVPHFFLVVVVVFFFALAAAFPSFVAVVRDVDLATGMLLWMK
jgi:hypothetical protein